MKISISLFPKLSKKIGLAILATSLVLVFNSCAQKVSFLNSSVVPAARGDVKVKKDNNSNYHIEVRLSNLAEVNRLEPARQSYVVWMESGQEKAKNIGKINSSSSFLSKRLKASFETVSAVKPNKIFIPLKMMRQQNIRARRLYCRHRLFNTIN